MGNYQQINRTCTAKRQTKGNNQDWPMAEDCLWKSGRMAPSIGAWRTGTVANKSCSPWVFIPTYLFQRHEKVGNRRKSSLPRGLILALSKKIAKEQTRRTIPSSRCRRVAGKIHASVDRKSSEEHLRPVTPRYIFMDWSRAVGEISAPELLSALRRIEARGHLENAHRALTNAGQVFMYAIATGRAERNPAANLRGAIPRPLPDRGISSAAAIANSSQD